MPNAYVLNQIPAGYGAAVSLFVEMLVSAGWTYKASGDGLAAYSATGKVFTGTGAVAGGWNNNKAWARLADPGGGREFVIQHNAGAGLRLKYSASAKFVGGSPSATTPPSATDERVMQGGGTDAAPSFCANFFSGNVATSGTRFQGAALATAPYGFWFFGANTPSGTATNAVIMMDPVLGVAEDPDPVVWYCCRSAGNVAYMTNTGGYGGSNSPPGGNNFGTWAHMDVAKSQFVYVDAMAYLQGGGEGGNISTTVNVVRGTAFAVNPFNGKDDILPIMYANPAIGGGPTPYGLKGWSTLVRYTGIRRNTILDTLNSKQWICAGNCWLPWDGVTSPMN